MAIALGQNAAVTNLSGVGATTVTTSGVTTQAIGSTFVIAVYSGSALTGTPVSDSFGNTYVLKASTTYFFGANYYSVYVCDNGSGGSGHTATGNQTSSGVLGVLFQEITGAANPSYDASANFYAGNTGVTSFTGAAVTTTNANDLILSFVGAQLGLANTYSDSGGWNALIDQAGFTAAASVCSSYLIVSSTGTYNDSYTETQSANPGGIAIAFKAASGGGSVPFLSVDTSNPSRRPIYYQDYNCPTPLELGIPKPTPPFSLLDQPSPSPRLNYYQIPDPPNLIILVAPKIVNSDQPSPSPRIKYQQIFDTLNLLVTAPPTGPPFNLLDQPNPSRRPISYPDQNQPNVVTLQAPKPQSAFNQTDWPNPSRRPISYQDQNGPSLLTIQTPPIQLPFSQADWPTPRRPISYPDQNQPNVVTLQAPKPQSAFNQTDWPNPNLKSRAQDVFIGSNLVILIPQISGPPFYLNDQPNPSKRFIYSSVSFGGERFAPIINPIPIPLYFLTDQPDPSPRLKYYQIPEPPNSLILGIPPVVVYTEYRSALILNTPVARKPAAVTEVGHNFLIQGIPASIAPFYSVDTPNPPRRPIYAVSGSYYGGERFAPSGAPLGPPPFYQTDQPNPIPRSSDLYAHTFSATVIQGFPPFNFTDWQRPPPRPVYWQQAESDPNYLPLGLQPPEPVNFTDWQNPPKRPVYSQDFNVPASLVFGLPKPTAPFNFTNWQNPSKCPTSYQDQNGPIPLILSIPKPTAPFSLQDQPNPSRRPISYQDQNEPIPFTLSIPIPAKPFIQENFDATPVPVKPRYQPDLVPNLLENTLVPVLIRLPFNNYDWPLFLRRKDINNEGIWLFSSIINSSTLQFWNAINFNQGSNWQPVNTGTISAWTPISTPNGNWNSVVTTTIPNTPGGVT